ncbi:MAG: uroporphyrinogen-III C-methyltransferase [Gammaproteobacteria bacterium]
MSESAQDNRQNTAPETDTEMPNETETVSAEKPAAKRSGATTWLALLAFLLSLAAAGGAGYLWTLQQQAQKSQSSIQKKQAQLLSQVEEEMAQVGSSVSQIRSGIEQMQTEEGPDPVVTALQQQLVQLTEQQQGQNQHIESLSTLISRSGSDWTLAEIEYLLRMANQRLQLFHDKDSAMVALSSADNQLQALADPRLQPVRQQIARDLDSLKSVPDTDLPGLLARLNALLEKIESLPVTHDHFSDTEKTGAVNTDTDQEQAEKPDNAESSRTANNEKADWRSLEDWQAVPVKVWNEIRGMVTIRELDSPVAPMLPADSEYFLKQNLRLQIEAAKLAAMRNDTVFFTDALQTSRNWLTSYFNTDAATVNASLDSIDELLSINLQPDLPDISGSLQQLQKFTKSNNMDAKP